MPQLRRAISPLRSANDHPTPSWPSLRTPFLVLLVAGALVAAAGGWALGAVMTGGSEPAPAPARTMDLGPVTLAVASGWTPERVAATGVPGLDASATAAFAPVPGLPAHAIVTLAPVTGPTLVPAALSELSEEPLGEPSRSELLGTPAWRYGELALTGDRVMEVTVAPTTRGVLAVACIAPSGLWAATVGCATGVRRLSLDGAVWLRPTRDLALRTLAPGAVERLDRRRVTLRAELQRATTRSGQSRLAGRLASAYDTAAASLVASSGAGASQPVIAALRRSAAAHRQLAVAAANAWPGRYDQARRAVKRGDIALKRALAALR